MTIRRLLSPLAAALALLSLPSAARPGDHAAAPQPAAVNAIAEGILKDGVRTIEMAVTSDGFVPSQVKVTHGEKVRLVVTRKTDRTCATEIVIKAHGIDQQLPLGKPVTVEFTPKKAGELRYACGMDMISGVVFVR